MGYLSKYVVKGAEIETILNKEVEQLREDEIKRLLGLYFMILFRLRQFSVLGLAEDLIKHIIITSRKVGDGRGCKVRI